MLEKGLEQGLAGLEPPNPQGLKIGKTHLQLIFNNTRYSISLGSAPDLKKSFTLIIIKWEVPKWFYFLNIGLKYINKYQHDVS